MVIWPKTSSLSGIQTYISNTRANNRKQNTFRIQNNVGKLFGYKLRNIVIRSKRNPLPSKIDGLDHRKGPRKVLIYKSRLDVCRIIKAGLLCNQ